MRGRRVVAWQRGRRSTPPSPPGRMCHRARLSAPSPTLSGTSSAPVTTERSEAESTSELSDGPEVAASSSPDARTPGEPPATKPVARRDRLPHVSVGLPARDDRLTMTLAIVNVESSSRRRPAFRVNPAAIMYIACSGTATADQVRGGGRQSPTTRPVHCRASLRLVLRSTSRPAGGRTSGGSQSPVCLGSFHRVPMIGLTFHRTR